MALNFSLDVTYSTLPLFALMLKGALCTDPVNGLKDKGGLTHLVLHT